MARTRVPRIPLSEAIEEFLQWLELDRHASPRTVAAYGFELDRFASFCQRHGQADLDVAAIDRDLVRAFQRSVARGTTGRTGARQPLAPTTRKRRLVALRSFLRFAQREEWLLTDLASTIDLPRLPERLPKPLEDSAREHLVGSLTGATLPELRDRAFVLLLLSSGARISELLRLDRTEWGEQRLILHGKGDRERPAMVTDRARHAVDTYLAARHDPSPALFIGFQPAAAGTSANRLTPAGAWHLCRQLAQRLGIPTFHPHQLRHSLGTLLQERLGDARLTAETLGHVGLGSVAGYTRITEGRRAAARAAVEDAGL